jgi:predicted dehydrogenase
MSWQRSNLNPFTADQDVVDNQVAIIEYANGVRASFHTNANCAFEERRLLIVGEEGTIRADVIKGLIEAKRIGWETPTLVYKFDGGGHGGGEPLLAEELLNCMFKDASPPLTLNDGLYSTIVALAIDKARNESCIVNLCPIWEKAGIDPYRSFSENS